jgi:hypothetical protein
MDNDDNPGRKVSLTDSIVHSSNGYNNYSRQINCLYPKSVSLTNNSPLLNSKDRQERNRSRAAYNALKSRRSVIKMLAVVVLIYFVSFSPQVVCFILFDTNAIYSNTLFYCFYNAFSYN